MMAILGLVGFMIGFVTGVRVLKLAIRSINSMFDKIEEKI